MSKVYDDSVFTQDVGSDRLYVDVGRNLRLRSHDSKQVVLEHYRESIPLKKGAPTYLGWFFVGFFGREEFLRGCYEAHGKLAEQWAGKRVFPIAVEHMLGRWRNIYTYFDPKLPQPLSSYFDTFKAHEADKSAVSAKKSWQTRNNGKPKE